jgi:hypothetical protein
MNTRKNAYHNLSNYKVNANINNVMNPNPNLIP